MEVHRRIPSVEVHRRFPLLEVLWREPHLESEAPGDGHDREGDQKYPLGDEGGNSDGGTLVALGTGARMYSPAPGARGMGACSMALGAMGMGARSEALGAGSSTLNAMGVSVQVRCLYS